jgi:hypothetical protein
LYRSCECHQEHGIACGLWVAIPYSSSGPTSSYRGKHPSDSIRQMNMGLKGHPYPHHDTAARGSQINDDPQRPANPLCGLGRIHWARHSISAAQVGSDAQQGAIVSSFHHPKFSLGVPNYIWDHIAFSSRLGMTPPFAKHTFWGGIGSVSSKVKKCPGRPPIVTAKQAADGFIYSLINYILLSPHLP